MNPWVEASASDAYKFIGAQDLEDGSDIEEVLDAFRAEFSGRVVEIGCGTGRLAKLCHDYVGYDVSPAFVALARSDGVDARLLPVPGDERGDWLVIVHVLCHLPREERLNYLRLDIAPRLLVDIIPGDSGPLGWPIIYPVPPEEFEDDLSETGWKVTAGPYERDETETRHVHRYYLCER